jgi:cytoskeletal protein RodZ
MGDFYHMPLKGHARNMVSSYARYLGLSPEEITKQFLSEYHDFENRETRRGSISALPTVTNSGRFETQPIPPSYTGKTVESQGVRSMWDKPIPHSELNRGYDSRSHTAQRAAAAASRRSTRTGIERPSASSRRPMNDSYTPRQSLPARLFGSLFSNPAVLITILILILVALLVAWAMLANSCKKEGESKNIQANGGAVVTETTATDGTDAAGTTDATGEPGSEDADAATDPRYGPFELVVEPAAGSAPWVSVTIDGETVHADLFSEKGTWEVTDSCTVSTGQPGNLTVTRNGEAVTLEADSQGAYTVTLTVKSPPASQEEESNG